MSNAVYQLRKIGIGLAGKDLDEPILHPEETLMLAASELKDDMSVLCLIAAWLESFSDLLDLKKLKETMTSASDESSKAVLMALLKKSGINLECEINTQKCTHKFPAYMTISAEIGQVPYDKDFAEYGLKVSAIEPEEKRKLNLRKHIVSQNTFFKNQKKGDSE